ncbi:MAG: ribosome maturation factor RimM [Pseudomonadales bacterium]|nr:ribosome maturation factor RimM [Pseudomonadales bacterium]
MTTQESSSDLLVIGVITQAFGIKGWVKVKSFTEPESNILHYRHCLLSHNGQQRKVEIEQARPQGKALALKLKGIDDRNQSELLRKAQLMIAADQLAQLPPDEYYWHQLQGLTVLLASEAASDLPILGVVSHLLETGSNDVLVVKPSADSLDQRERLLPYRPEVVLEVDLDAGTLSVDWDPDF